MIGANIANIYFKQKNYRLSAQYWTENYRRVGICDDKIGPQRIFFMKQGALNNAAFAYEKAGLIDSAKYYYNLDRTCLDMAEKSNAVNKHNIATARIVLFDNLAGLSLKEGDYAQAAVYLKTCIGVNITTTDGIKIPPYIKLAELNMNTGNYATAADAWHRHSR